MTKSPTAADNPLRGGGEHILVVDDDKAFRVAARTLLEDEGYAVQLASSGDGAMEKLNNEEFDLLLSDLVMGKMSGIQVLQQAKSMHRDMPVIMVTGFGSIETAVEAMRLGATDYLTKPCNNDELLIKVRRALDMQQRDQELSKLREELRTVYAFGNMVSQSPLMKEVIKQIQQVADTDVTILIQGESGTGKELVARALHFNSSRAAKPFVAVNCSAIPENLLESELFGHEKGSFTGATRQRTGRFEEAHEGTLFLDEIGDISSAIQTKLLRAIQEKTFERIGGNAPVTVETRIVAATNRNLEMMARQGDFREDLFYRLNVFPITLPPLRDRIEDIPLLAEHFLQRFSGLSGGRVKFIAPQVISDMMSYSWRGNIRELENLVKRAMIKTPGDTITAVELPNLEAPGAGDLADAEGAHTMDTPYKEYLSAILRHAEERYLIRMLRLHKGNINQISRLMEVDRKTVYRKLSEYAIDPGTYREER